MTVVLGVVPALHDAPGLGLGLLDVREGLGYVDDLIVDENPRRGVKIRKNRR